MKILALYRKNSACDYHRIFMPFRFLPLEDGEEIKIKEDDEILSITDFEGVDLVVFNRHPTAEMEKFVELRERYGFKIWVDVDDSWSLDKSHYLYDSWSKSNVSQLIERSISMADVVTVTNQRLVRKATTLNSKCVIIPNALPIGFEQFRADRTESSKTRFIYTGGPSHVGDLRLIESFFKATGSGLSFKEKAKFIMCGYEIAYNSVPLRQMNDIMSSAANYQSLPSLSLNNYMEHYNQGDIVISPLMSTEFNWCKSNLKVIEAGCMGLPIIVSSTYPYLEDYEMKNKGIFFCTTAAEWYETALDLIENPEKIAQSGEQLYDYVRRKYDLLKVNNLRRELINRIKQTKHDKNI